MKKSYRLALLVGLFSSSVQAQINTIPTLANIRTHYDPATTVLSVSYDLSDQEESSISVSFVAHDAEGLPVSATVVGGDVNQSIAVGSGRQFAVRLGENAHQLSQLSFRLTADDGVPVSIDELISRIDTNRIRKRVEAISGVRHPASVAGLKHLQEVREQLAQSFQSFDCAVRRQSFEFAGYKGQNIIGTSAGTTDTPLMYALCAAYDGSWITPGANMNASGVAGMLEILEILAELPHKNMLTAIGLDYSGDDEFIGSNYYLFKGGLTRREKLRGAINLDRIGSYSEQVNSLRPDSDFRKLFPDEYKKLVADSMRANFMTIVCNNDSRPLADAVIKYAQRYVPHLKYILEDYPGYGECTGGNHCTIFKVQQSDHVPFWYRRLRAIHVTDGHAGEYSDNQEDDSTDKINYAFINRLLRPNLAALAELIAVQHAQSVSFTVNQLATTKD